MVAKDKIASDDVPGSTLKILPLGDLPTNDYAKAFADIKRIEKKSFPRTEVFDFDNECKKANTRVLVVLDRLQGKEMSPAILGYLVYLRVKRTALLHKICIDEVHRHQKIGTRLMVYFVRILRSSGCDNVQLWVDRERQAARNLYVSSGFEVAQTVENYYGPGRTASKMILQL